MIDLICLVDVETSGLLRKDLSLDSSEQPSIVQIAAKTVDSKRRCVGQFSRIVRTEAAIEEKAFQTHGISQEYSAQVGADLVIALAELKASVEGVSRIVGHNVGFDYDVISSALSRAGAEGIWWRAKASKLYDTMESSSPILQIPGRFDDWKFPTLAESVNYFAAKTNALKWVGWEPSHNAMDDVSACEFVYWSLQDLTVVRSKSGVSGHALA